MFSNFKTIKSDLFMFNLLVIFLACSIQLSMWFKDLDMNKVFSKPEITVTVKPKMKLIMTTEGMKAIPVTETMYGNPTVIPKPLSKAELAKVQVKIDNAIHASTITIVTPKPIQRKGFDIKPRQTILVDNKVVDKNSYNYKIMHEEPIVPMSAWDDFIAEKAREYNVPVSLAFSIINLESDFNHKAVNKGSGATGLGQMLPNTAIHVAKMKGDYAKHKKIFGSDKNARAYYAEYLKNPKNNVNYCIYYLGYLKTTHKTWFKAIKAYSGHYNNSNKTFIKKYGFKVQKYLVNHNSLFRLY